MLETIGQFVMTIIVGLANKYPLVVSLVSLVGVLRLIFKPLFTFLHAVVDATPNPNDNATLDSVESSKIVSAIRFILDLFASVKLP